MNALLSALFAELLKGLGDVFLGWLRDRQATETAKDLGREEEANAVLESAARRADEIGAIAARPDDPDELFRRLRDGSA